MANVLNNNRRLYPIKSIITRDVIPVKLSHNYNVVVYKELYPIHVNDKNYKVNGSTYYKYLEEYYTKYLIKQTGTLEGSKFRPVFGGINQQALALGAYSKTKASRIDMPIFSAGLVVGFTLPDAQIDVEQMSVANVKYPVLNSVVNTPTFSMEVVEDAESNVLTNILFLMASQFNMAFNGNSGRGVAYPPFVVDGLTIEVLIYSDYPNSGNIVKDGNSADSRDNIKFKPQYKIVFKDCILTSYTNTGYQAAGDRLQYTLNFAHKHIDIVAL